MASQPVVGGHFNEDGSAMIAFFVRGFKDALVVPSAPCFGDGFFDDGSNMVALIVPSVPCFGDGCFEDGSDMVALVATSVPSFGEGCFEDGFATDDSVGTLTSVIDPVLGCIAASDAKVVAASPMSIPDAAALGALMLCS